VQNHDILDRLVLELLEKETLDKAQIAEIFRDVRHKPARPAWTGSNRRVPSDRPPVKTPKELELAKANGSVNGGLSITDLPGQGGLADG
jgi:cell division protease FtsH